MPMRQRRLRRALHSAGTLLLSFAAFTACSWSDGTAPTATPLSGRSNVVVTEPDAGPWARIAGGETGPGSLYQVYVPRNWNGDLVTVAHGFRDAALPVSLAPESYLASLRDALGASGYAVAYSSYSENGFAVKDGAQRTHQLRGLAVAQLDSAPNRTFLVGFSLGSGIALSLAEQFPAQYDGALLACGMVGGSRTQTQYLGHVRVLFDASFPGLLDGNVLGVPAGYSVNPLQVQQAVVPNLPKLSAIASTAQTPLPFVPGASAVPSMIESLITALSFHARGINNITDLVHGKSPFGNIDESYTLGTPVFLPATSLTPMIAQLDATAQRYTMSPSAQAYLSLYDTPTGNIGTKVLSLHNRWDPVVPAFHEDSLYAAASRAGSTANLVQRIRPQFGHCTYSASDLMTAFGDLEAWSRTGIRPN